MNRQITRVAVVALGLLAALVVATTYWQTWAPPGLAARQDNAILRVAHVTRSKYEWTQHATLARRVGVTDAEIAAIAVDGPVRGLDEEGRLLCRVAEEISRDVRLSDEALRAILDRYGRRQAVELILCCSHFNMVSRIIESTRVELEPENRLEKWEMPQRSSGAE